jgi:hypothetical protein
MNAEVVDTNVLVAANARDTHISPECADVCIDALLSIQYEKIVVIDDGWRILGEYQRNANSQSQPGPGDAFLLWILRNHFNPERCEQVRITALGGSDSDFEEFPLDPDLERLDRSDRKFVAVARERVATCRAQRHGQRLALPSRGAGPPWHPSEVPLS